MLRDDLLARLTGDSYVRVCGACCGRYVHSYIETMVLSCSGTTSSMLTIPIVPNLVYGALLISVRVALRRRLRAAWWVFVIWWIIIPQLVKSYSIISGGPLLQTAGLMIMSAVLVTLWRDQAPVPGPWRTGGTSLAAIICFLLGRRGDLGSSVPG